MRSSATTRSGARWRLTNCTRIARSARCSLRKPSSGFEPTGTSASFCTSRPRTSIIRSPLRPASSERAAPVATATRCTSWTGWSARSCACSTKRGLTEDTLVLFISDNGGMFNRGGQTAWETGHRLNGDLLGMKFGAWEGGHRVPFLARWPGHVPAGAESSELVSNVDFLATFAALVGRTLDNGEGPDSFNILPALQQRNAEPIRDYLIISPASSRHLSIRKGRWMYIPAQNEGGFGGTRLGEHTVRRCSGIEVHRPIQQRCRRWSHPRRRARGAALRPGRRSARRRERLPGQPRRRRRSTAYSRRGSWPRRPRPLTVHDLALSSASIT